MFYVVRKTERKNYYHSSSCHEHTLVFMYRVVIEFGLTGKTSKENTYVIFQFLKAANLKKFCSGMLLRRVF